MKAKSTLASEERLWAALAHAAGLMPLIGPLGAVIVWFIQRKRSAFSRFQALQAMAYQAIATWLWIVVLPVVMTALMLIFITVIANFRNRSGEDNVVVLLLLLVWLPMIASLALYVLVAAIGAIASLMGRNFRYPLLGRWLTRYVGYISGELPSISDEKEDYALAAISHATGVLWLWGLATPVILWITQKDRSKFLRFQALQAAVYQGLGGIAYVALMAVYMISVFGMTAMGTLGDVTKSARELSGQGAIFWLPSLCLGAAVLIAVPFYQLFGLIASIQTLRGHDYHYPFLGKFLARRAAQQPPAGEAQ